MVNAKLLSKGALCAAVFALGVIALGAFTRLMDAGLGCPDWPGCYGHLTVPTSAEATAYPGTPLVAYKAWAEMVHRYFVGGLSLFILAIIGLIVMQKKLRTRGNSVLATLLASLLVYQILLGQWTVTLKLLPIVVTQHLLGGFLILSVLWLIYLTNKSWSLPASRQINRGVLFAAIAGVVLLFLQIMLGAWTSTNYASLSCPDFPFCMNDQTVDLHFKAAFHLFSPIGVNYEGGVLPTLLRQTIQMAHRFGALIVTLYLFILSAFIVLKFKNLPALQQSIYAVLGLMCIQLCLGISNVIFKLPLVTALSHTIVAALLLLSLMTLTCKLIIIHRGASAK